MQPVKQYFKNILIGIDQLANTIIGGDPDETISSRVGKCHRKDYGKSLYYFTLLPWFIINCIFYIFSGWGHCEQCIEEDEGSQDLINE